MNQFDTLTNQIFFNILIHKADKSVLDFIQTYFPYLCEKPEQQSWSIYPSYSTETGELQKTEHNLLFYKHPFLHFEFSEGKLEVLSSELKGFSPRIRQMRLSFLFENEMNANKALNSLIEKFDSVSHFKIIKDEDGHKLVIFRPTEKEEDGVMFILSKDELIGKKYKLHFGYETIMRLD